MSDRKLRQQGLTLKRLKFKVLKLSPRKLFPNGTSFKVMKKRKQDETYLHKQKLLLSGKLRKMKLVFNKMIDELLLRWIRLNLWV